MPVKVTGRMQFWQIRTILKKNGDNAFNWATGSRTPNWPSTRLRVCAPRLNNKSSFAFLVSEYCFEKRTCFWNGRTSRAHCCASGNVYPWSGTVRGYSIWNYPWAVTVLRGPRRRWRRWLGLKVLLPNFHWTCTKHFHLGNIMNDHEWSWMIVL